MSKVLSPELTVGAKCCVDDINFKSLMNEILIVKQLIRVNLIKHTR